MPITLAMTRKAILVVLVVVPVATIMIVKTIKINQLKADL